MAKKPKPWSRGCKYKGYVGRQLYANVFEVYIFDTRANMVNGVQKWVQERHYKKFNSEEITVAGLVLEEEETKTVTNAEDGIDYCLFAAMFLNEQDLTIDIAAHEAVHAAMVHERNIIKYIGLYEGNDDTGEAPEERLAYTIGEYVEQIMLVCQKEHINLRVSPKIGVAFKELKSERKD
jgi:hypothetical protein